MLEPWQTGKVIKIINETPTTKRFWIEVSSLKEFNFQPGQFVTLDLPIHEQKNKRWRSYSIASAPDNTNIFELVIVRLEGGLGTRYLFEDVDVEIGTELLLRGPAGKFTLPETLDKDLYLICTGTGIAPFRSMVQYIHAHKIPHQNIHLIFGCRTMKDALYVDELKQLEKKESQFYFHPTCSREINVTEGFNIGYVHTVYEKLIQQSNSSELLPHAYFYLCGWKQMIDEAKDRIIQLGYDKKAIHLELYG